MVATDYNQLGFIKSKRKKQTANKVNKHHIRKNKTSTHDVS